MSDHKPLIQGIQGGGGFIHDQNIGVQNGGHGQKSPLNLSAAQLVGIAAVTILGQTHVRKAREARSTPLFDLPIRFSEGFGHLVHNPVGRVQGLGPVLKDH
jgi:hypothetical protein